MRDGVLNYQKDYMPDVARLEIPLTSVVNLRRVASELRGLAERLDWLSRDTDDATAVLFEAWTAVRHTGRRCGKIRRPGRPLAVGRRKPTKDRRRERLAEADHNI